MVSRLLITTALYLTLATDGRTGESVRVFIYRYRQLTGFGVSPSVYCDEVQLARMENGRYFVVTLPPGKHAFHSNDKQSGIELDGKEGQDYYIRVELATGGAKARGRLVVTPTEQGLYDIRNLKPIDPDKIKDLARVTAPPPNAEDKSGAQERPLTNRDVIALKEAGIGDEVIIARIKSVPDHFSLDPDDLIQLKKAGLSDKVISAMVESVSRK